MAPEHKIIRLLAALILAVVAIVGCARDGNDELRSAPEWSVLQNLEVKYRGQATPTVMIEKQERHCAAGVLALERSSRVWILLDARYQPLVKKLPDIDYNLSANDLAEILEACAPTAEVLAELKSRVLR